MNAINAIQEKPDGDGGWVNGGFFVLSCRVIDRIEGDHTIWERDPLESLASDGVMSYEGYHEGSSRRHHRLLRQSSAEYLSGHGFCMFDRGVNAATELIE